MKIGIITDIHEDAERLIFTLKSLEKLGVDRLFCLGDISGFDERFYSYKFSKNFAYCLDIIMKNCEVILPGNHDLFHLSMLPKYSSAFHFPENWYQLSFAERKSISKGLIWLYEKDYPIGSKEIFSELMQSFYDNTIVEYDGIKMLLTHSIAPDISGFLTKKPTKWKDFAEHLELLKKNDCAIGLSGHLHPNGIFRIDEKKMHNPRFGALELSDSATMQYICPCLANGMQDNGFVILDTKNKTIESIPLRTPKSNFY